MSTVSCFLQQLGNILNHLWLNGIYSLYYVYYTLDQAQLFLS